tara:strand:+ start:367 stop:1557 length:1191 start_codon:yes stop_codon:yes gene_type:complete
MKKILLCLLLLVSSQIKAQNKAQNFVNSLYKDFLKYGTIYGAGEVRNSVEAPYPTYVVRTNENGSLYDIPRVEDNTIKYPFDYRYGFGIRKLARFDYERKPKNYYDGTEDQLVFTAPSSAIQGLEYQFHKEWERWMGREFDNSRYFLKHTGKYHIVKAESRKVDRINLKYQSAETRARLPIGKKFSISAGAIFRTHDRPYGYNPIEIWLNETDDTGNAVNPWYTLGYQYGYNDVFYTQTTANGDTTQDWCWVDPDGNEVAHSDLAFRENVYPLLMNRYNNEIWSQLSRFGEIAPVIGFDFYHYESKFWLHAYANWILPYHHYVMGDEDFSYLHRDNWGKGGHNNLLEGKQWSDYNFGANLGWKVGKNLGIFVEGEYSKMWDSQLYQTTFGLNYTFR